MRDHSLYTETIIKKLLFESHIKKCCANQQKKAKQNHV